MNALQLLLLPWLGFCVPEKPQKPRLSINPAFQHWTRKQALLFNVGDVIPLAGVVYRICKVSA